MYRRKEDALQALALGTSIAKRPRTLALQLNLEENSTIDLLRVDPEASAKAAPKIPNNRERQREKKVALPEMDYRPGEILENLKKLLGQHVEVIMPCEHLLNASKVVKKRSIWGNNIYTADSDLFTVLVHQGYIPHNVSEPGFHWPEPAKELRAILRVLPAQTHYFSHLRNTMKSRAWAASCFNCSYCVERVWVVTHSEVCVELHSMRETGGHDPILPSFLLSQWDQRMNTRQISHSSERRKRQQSDVATIMYNLVNEPWLKYTSTLMADRGFTTDTWTCTRFHKEVLYLETEGERYEMFLTIPVNGDSNVSGPKYALRQCKSFLPQDIMLAKGVPLPAELTTVVHDNLEWEDIQWGTCTVEIQHGARQGAPTTTSYAILRVHWMPIGRPTAANGGSTV